MKATYNPPAEAHGTVDLTGIPLREAAFLEGIITGILHLYRGPERKTMEDLRVALREATFYGTDDIWLTTQDWYLEGASVVADITGMTEK